jgi:hypothetical protein
MSGLGRGESTGLRTAITRTLSLAAILIAATTLVTCSTSEGTAA